MIGISIIIHLHLLTSYAVIEVCLRSDVPSELLAAKKGRPMCSRMDFPHVMVSPHATPTLRYVTFASLQILCGQYSYLELVILVVCALTLAFNFIIVE